MENMSSEQPRPSKRTFLRGMFGALAASTLGGDSERNEQVGEAALIKNLEERFSARVMFELPAHAQEKGAFQMDTLSNSERRDALLRLTRVLERYPTDFFRLQSLATIHLGRDLQMKARAEGEWASISGFADGRSDFIIVEFDEEGILFERTLHHELYHILDFRTDSEWEDARSDKLQDLCQCGSYAYSYSVPKPEPGSPLGPFVEIYGTSFPSEDRATFAAALFEPEAHAALQERTGYTHPEPERSVLTSKLKAVLAQYYEWSGGKMNEMFWGYTPGTSSTAEQK